MNKFRMVCGFGVNDSNEKVKINGKIIKSYTVWRSMLLRCYDENCELKRHFEINGKNRIKDRITEMCFPQLVVGNSKRIFNKDSFLNNLK